MSSLLFKPKNSKNQNQSQKIKEKELIKKSYISKNKLQNKENINSNISSKLSQNQDKTPKIIILYGPPAAGKGTQADFLKKNLPDYFHLDFGTTLRSFVALELGNYFEPKINKQIASEIQNPEIQKILKNLENKNNTDSKKTNIYQSIEKISKKLSQELKSEKPPDNPKNLIDNNIKNQIDNQIDNKIRAYRIWQALTKFEAVLFEDLQFVVENSLKKALQNGKKIILEGPGRSLLEANWLSELFASLELEVAIFHLYISPSETVKRSATRFYVKGIEKPFQSYKVAKENCPNGEPYRRPEDEDSDGIMNRYNKLYADIFAQIISVYQLKAKAIVLTVDAHKEVETVSQTIENYLTKWYL